MSIIGRWSWVSGQVNAMSFDDAGVSQDASVG